VTGFATGVAPTTMIRSYRRQNIVTERDGIKDRSHTFCKGIHNSIMRIVKTHIFGGGDLRPR
jgi:hypothetical protein